MIPGIYRNPQPNDALSPSRYDVEIGSDNLADERHENGTVRDSTLEAGTALAGIVQTTLGPNGMDKMLVGRNGTVIVTNDGASILDRVEIEDPIGRLLMTTAENHNRRVGDGTTTMILLAGELLSEARSLLTDGLHPTTIIDGYNRAVTYARERLPEYGRSIAADDERLLKDTGKTVVTGRWGEPSTERFAELTVSALRTVDFDPSRITVMARSGGELRDSELIDGLLVDMDASSTTVDTFERGGRKTYSDPRIVMVDDELVVEQPDAVETVAFDDIERAREFHEHERTVRSEIVRAIRRLDVDVVVCQKSIDETVRAELSRAGVLIIERTRQDEFDAIARATGANTVQSIDELAPSAVGKSGSIRRRDVGRAELLCVLDPPIENRSSLLLRGGTPHVADETQRIIEDCTAIVQLALQDGLVVPGGGASAIALSGALSAYADRVGGREQAAIKSFADSLERVPRVLATNAGRDPIDALTTLRNRHHDSGTAVGLDRSGRPRDMFDAGVIEPYSVLDRSLTNAVEAASLILRIDDVLSTTSGDENERNADAHRNSDRDTRDTSGYPWAIGH